MNITSEEMADIIIKEYGKSGARITTNDIADWYSIATGKEKRFWTPDSFDRVLDGASQILDGSVVVSITPVGKKFNVFIGVICKNSTYWSWFICGNPYIHYDKDFDCLDSAYEFVRSKEDEIMNEFNKGDSNCKVFYTGLCSNKAILSK